MPVDSGQKESRHLPKGARRPEITDEEDLEEQKPVEVDLGPFTDEDGLERHLVRTWVEEKGDYEYKKRRDRTELPIFYYDRQTNDWRNEHRRRCISKVSGQLTDLDAKAGFRELDLYRQRRQAMQEKRAVPPPDTSERTVADLSRKKKEKPAETQKRHLGKIAYENAEVSIDTDDRTHLSLLGDHGFKSYHRRGALKDINYYDDEDDNKPAPTALAIQLDMLLYQKGLIQYSPFFVMKKKERDTGAERGKKIVSFPAQPRLPAQERNLISGPAARQISKGNGSEDEVDGEADATDYEQRPLRKRELLPEARADLEPGYPEDSGSPERSPSLRHHQPNTLRVSGRDLNNLLTYLFAMKGERFVDQAIAGLAQSAATENFRERSERYQAMLSSRFYDEAVKFLQTLPIAEEIGDEIKSIEEKNPEERREYETMELQIPAALQNDTFYLVLPLETETEYLKLQQDLFDHSTEVLRSIGKVSNIDEKATVVLCVKGVDFKTATKAIGKLANAPQSLTQAGVALGVHLYWSKSPVEKDEATAARPRRTKKSYGDELSVLDQIIAYGMDKGHFAIRDAADHIGKTPSYISANVTAQANRQYFTFVHKGVYSVTAEGRKRLESGQAQTN